MKMSGNSFFLAGIVILAGVLTLAAATYQLSEAPAIWYDEGFYTQMAMNFADRGAQVLQVAPGEYTSSSYVTVGYPLIAPIAASYKMFGIGVLQGRWVMLFFLCGFVVAAYILVRHLYGPQPAAWTALLLSTFPMLYGNGKPVLGEVPGLFFLFLTLIALEYLERTEYRDWRGYVLVGLGAGLCAATKMFFALFVIALGVTFLLRIRHIHLNWRLIMVGGVSLLLPLLLWAYMQFGSDASVSSVLSYYSNPYAVDDLPAHMVGNMKRFISETTPLFTLILMIVWSISLLIRRRENKTSVAELAAYVFCILVILSYLRLEGWYRYLFPATAVSLVFFSAALLTCYEAGTLRLPLLKKWPWAVYTALTLLASLQLDQTMRTSYVAGHYGSKRTQEVSSALRTIDSSKTIFIYNTPELAILLPTKEYYQYLDPLPNVHLGEEYLPVLESGGTDMAIVESSTYQKHSTLFSHYTEWKTADRYVLLERK